MAYHKGSSDSSVLDMKGVLASLANRIAHMTYDVTMSNEQPTLRGWSSLIEAFEATMAPYLDKKYFASKKDLITASKGGNKRQVFKAWLGVFSLLCKSMGKYGAYPMTFFDEELEHDHPEYIKEDQLNVKFSKEDYGET